VPDPAPAWPTAVELNRLGFFVSSGFFFFVSFSFGE
jgi:hypothetical protein